MPVNKSKLAKIQAAARKNRVGGKGTVRRKHKAVRKNANSDDKKVMKELNRLNLRDIPGIEEVNMFTGENSVIHFNNPKVHAALQGNTYVVSGKGEDKQLQDLLPGIISQLGNENLDVLKQLYSKMAAAGGDDVPDLTGNFEDVADEDSDDDDVPDLEES
jgi:nascent polypeptide-associated complex subunit beta